VTSDVSTQAEGILRVMHSGRSWRTFSQCRKVIGADDETTKRLLIEVGARASEGEDNPWGLMSRNPFEDKAHLTRRRCRSRWRGRAMSVDLALRAP
jgi:hypothetical protein